MIYPQSNAILITLVVIHRGMKHCDENTDLVCETVHGGMEHVCFQNTFVLFDELNSNTGKKHFTT